MLKDLEKVQLCKRLKNRKLQPLLLSAAGAGIQLRIQIQYCSGLFLSSLLAKIRLLNQTDLVSSMLMNQNAATNLQHDYILSTSKHATTRHILVELGSDFKEMSRKKVSVCLLLERWASSQREKASCWFDWRKYHSAQYYRMKNIFCKSVRCVFLCMCVMCVCFVHDECVYVCMCACELV